MVGGRPVFVTTAVTNKNITTTTQVHARCTCAQIKNTVLAEKQAAKKEPALYQPQHAAYPSQVMMGCWFLLVTRECMSSKMFLVDLLRSTYVKSWRHLQKLGDPKKKVRLFWG